MKQSIVGRSIFMALALLFIAAQMPAYAGDKLDVNMATAEQLQQVKGIGEKTAAAIINYRTEHGSFKSLDDLAKVRGIGEKKLEQMRGSLMVGANPCNPCAGKNPCNPCAGK